MRVGAVPEGKLLRALGQGRLLVGGRVRDRVGSDVLAAEVVRDRRVVRGRVREGLSGGYEIQPKGSAGTLRDLREGEMLSAKLTLTAMRWRNSSDTVPLPAFHCARNSS